MDDAAPPGSIVFVTENPSVIAAAADLTASGFATSVVCTARTPAPTEIKALSTLPDLGWQVLVRTDFDVAGIEHVRALLAGIAGASPWRMDAAHYERYARSGAGRVPLLGSVAETTWDPPLASSMSEHGVAVYEESLLHDPLEDVSQRRDSRPT